MAIKKITRKVIPSAETPSKATSPKKEESSVRVKKCSFCQSNTNPSYTDLEILRRFLSDRVKIVPKERSGVCSKHQRAVAINIKYARHLALLPFVPKV